MKQRTEYIYKIECKVNGKVYVGRTCNLVRRKREHFRKLKQNKHQNKNIQYSYNKYGEETFEFSCIEQTTSTLVKQRELFYFEYFKSLGIELFNHCITSSDGGVDSKSEITRTYIFDILDKRITEGKSYRQLAKEYRTSTATLMQYTEEWEELRGMKMPASTQTESTLQRIQKFVQDFNQGLSPRYKDYNLSTQALHKYLSRFNLSFDDVRLDKKFQSTEERTMKAIREVRQGIPLVDAKRLNDISSTTYYKYLKSFTEQTNLD